MANRLGASKSPYLRQHADNPVDWWEWCEEAFVEARRRDVPVLVSIGYATCHWCHVMAHETFEDPETAALMNRYFVNIKVDREERPDVDAIYMDAVHALNGRGGWPLNAFVDHERRPFFAAMYFPRERWQGVVTHLGRAWVEDRAQVARSATALTQHLVAMGDGRPRAETEGLAALFSRWDEELARRYDPVHPGLGRAPKFPASQAIILEASRVSRREAAGLSETQAEAALVRVVAMLETMQDSGLHDRVGGGFHRYATDRHWRVPHFEKMLYDQAQLLVGYALGAALSGREDLWRTARGIAAYVERDLRVFEASGRSNRFVGYASAEDADDPGGEGSFYAWSPEAVRAALGGAAIGATGEVVDALIRAWDLAPGERQVGPSGHLEPVTRHIPHPRAHDLEALARELGLPDAQALRASWEAFIPALREARNRRPRPIRDDKVLTDLNGLWLEGIATLSRLDPDPELRAGLAGRVAEVVDVLRRRIKDDEVERLDGQRGYVTDYGHLAVGLLESFRATGDPGALGLARKVVELAQRRLAHPEGGFFSTPDNGEVLIRRSRETSDGAWPSGQHALARACVMLGRLSHDEGLIATARSVFEVQRGLAERAPTAYATLLQAMLEESVEAVTVVITGVGDRSAALAEAARRVVRPSLFVVEADRFDAGDIATLPLLEGRLHLERQAAMVCVGTACLLPIEDPEVLSATLATSSRPGPGLAPR